MQGPKLNRQVPPRRKWRDWSECSASCFKTRVRIYCDDLLAENTTFTTNGSNKLNSTGAPIVNENTVKRQTDDAIEKTEESEERDLLSKADQVEDDDYADEGDEEDQTDACDKVDLAKSVETKPCVGGLCRPPTMSGVDHQHQNVAPPALINTRTRHKDRLNAGKYWDQSQRQQPNPKKGECWNQ